MATSTVDVTGQSPLSFSDSNGAQRFVPLSAFAFSGSKVALKSAWASEFTSAEQTILLALASARASAGELTPPPVLPPMAAILFSAAVEGPEGNNITVSVTPDAGTVLTAKAKINATETDTYAGLADAAAAADVIGYDSPPPAGARAGTGLVMIKQSQAINAGMLPKAQTLAVVAAGVDVIGSDDSTKLFKLIPRAGAPSAGIPVKITVDATAGTFTLQASYSAGNTAKIVLAPLDPLPASVAYVATAAAPPGGIAMPTTGDVRLTGGGDGVAATGTAYTS